VRTLAGCGPGRRLSGRLKGMVTSGPKTRPWERKRLAGWRIPTLMCSVCCRLPTRGYVRQRRFLPFVCLWRPRVLKKASTAKSKDRTMFSAAQDNGPEHARPQRSRADPSFREGQPQPSHNYHELRTAWRLPDLAGSCRLSSAPVGGCYASAGVVGHEGRGWPPDSRARLLSSPAV
jgi:hypothetical protein